MKNYKPLFDRLIVFSVPIRQRIQGSVLFAGNSKRGSFQRAEEIWIVAAGPDCKEAFAPGSHGWLCDSFELEPTDLDLWDELRDMPQFEQMRLFVQSVEGTVKTSIVSERSILALDDGYEIDTITRGMPKD